MLTLRRLGGLHERSPYHELGGLLGSMRLLLDGSPADRSLIQDWIEAVHTVINGNRYLWEPGRRSLEPTPNE